MTHGPALAASFCACITFFSGYSTNQRILAFSASAIVLACTLLSLSRSLAG